MPAKKRNSKKVAKKNVKKPTKTKQQHKNRFFVGLLTAALVIGGITALLITLNEPISDAQLLRNAVENSISKKTATLTYLYENEGDRIESVYDVDYTDINNVVARGTTIAEVDEQNELATSGVFEVVVGPEGLTYGRATELDHDSALGGDVVDQWYSLDVEDVRENVNSYISLAGDNIFANTMIGMLISGEGVATTQGEVPDGNFSEEQRADILAIVDEETPYVITSSEKAEIDGRSLRKVALTMQRSGVNSVAQEVAQIVGEDSFVRLSQDLDVVAYIDTDVQRFYKVSFADGQSVTITNVNEPVALEIPGNATDFAEYLRTL